MVKAIRSLFQLIVLLAAGWLVMGYVMQKEVPPDRGEDLWAQRDGFIAISYGGLEHNFGDEEIMHQEMFEEHIKALIERGYTFITTGEVLRFLTEGRPLPEKPIYLMFEGGRKDSFLFAHSVLTKHQVYASLYLPTDKVTDRDRFFLNERELGKVSDSLFWDANSMGHNSGLINRLPDGSYSYYLADSYRDQNAELVELPEEYEKRANEDLRTSVELITEATKSPPLSFIFMPANTLDQSMAEDRRALAARAIERHFPMAFTKEGECFNSRDVDIHRLNRLIVRPDWSPGRLLVEIESRLPFMSYGELPNLSDPRKWRKAFGVLFTKGDTTTLSSLPDKDGFAYFQGANNLSNLLCDVSVTPDPNGAAALYLRYKNSGSYVRIVVRSDGVQVQEKLDTMMNTLLRYRHPQPLTGAVRLHIVVKGNRLLLDINGEPASEYPIPLSPTTNRGGLAIGAIQQERTVDAVFTGLSIKAFPPKWLEAADLTALDNAALEQVTAAILPFGPKPGQESSDPDTNLFPDGAQLLSAASRGLAVYFSLDSATPEMVEAFFGQYLDAPENKWLARLIHGVILPLPGRIDDRTEESVQIILDRDMELIARIDRRKLTAVSSEMDAVPGMESLPDTLHWILIDGPGPPPETVLDELGHRYDRKIILVGAGADTGGSPTFFIGE